MAQRTKATYKTLYGLGGATLADNTTGDISAEDVQQWGEDQSDTFLSIEDNFIDEDSFASDSATKAPSQQSVKAYVDAQAGAQSVDLYSRVFEDFDMAPTGAVSLATFSNGGGLGSTGSSGSGIDATEKVNGAVSLSTASSTAGGAALTNITYLLTFGFGFTHTLSFRSTLDTLSDGTNTYTARIGFLDAQTGAPTDGAYFRYTHSVNGGRWQAVTVSNSVETAEDTGVAPAGGVYQVLKIVANSDATQVDFYIDGTKTNDITTNIINSSSRLTGQVAMIEKTAGATARFLYVDYYEKITQRTTAR